MPTTFLDQFGKKIVEYTWEEYQRRLGSRQPWKGDVDLNGKVLVIKHTWGIGDILYSTPALRGLKKKYPGVKIHYICTNPDVLENNPDVEKVYHYMEFDDLTLLGDSLQETGNWYWLDYDVPLKGGYDYKIHLRTKPQLNEFMASLLLKDPKTLTGDERLFVDQASSSVISRYKMVALDTYCKHAFVDEKDTEKSVFYYPYDSELEMAKRFLKPLRERDYKVITLLPHASTTFKDYPHWREVIRLCPPNYFWLVLDSFSRGSWIGPNIQNCAGLFRTRPAMAIVIEGDLCCSSDTGFLYPKAARGGKCVVTYGPHEPEPFLHYFPSAHGLRVPSVTGLLEEGKTCCSTGCFIDTSSCKGEGVSIAPCLDQLSPKLVAAKIQELLG